MIDTLIGITIALLPLYIRLAGNLETNRTSKDFLFLYLIIAFLVILNGSLKSKYIRYSVLGLISLTIINQYFVFSKNVITYSIFITSGLIFFLKYYEYDGARNTQKIYDGMIIGSIIQGIIAIFGYFGINIYPVLVNIFYPGTIAEFKGGITGKNNVVGSLGNYNLLASYLCICIPAFFSRPRIKYLSIIPITALVLSHSELGIGCLIVGFFYYTRLLSKIKMYLLAISGMIIFPFLNLNLDSSRFIVWFRIIKDSSLYHKLMGMGPGWFSDSKFIISTSEYFREEHSVFMSIFNTYGLLGFVILLPIFYKYLKGTNDDRILSTILFVIFCNSYGHFSFHQSTVMIIIIPILALNLRRITT